MSEQNITAYLYAQILSDFFNAVKYKRIYQPDFPVSRNYSNPPSVDETQPHTLIDCIQFYLYPESSLTEQRITLKAQDTPPDSLKGMLEQYKSFDGIPEHLDILYSSKANRCHKRYTIIKEGCNAILCTLGETTRPIIGAYNTDAISLLESCTDIWSNEPLSASEKLSENMAADLLLPWFERDNIIQKLEDGQPSMDIAIDYRVPEFMVRRISDKSYAELYLLLKALHKD